MKRNRNNSILRGLDFFLGIPLLAVCGLLPRRSEATFQLKRIAIISVGCIGDAILLSGPLADFKTAFPCCHITCFTNGPNKDVMSLINEVDHVVPLPLTRPDQAVRMIRRSGTYDLCIDAGQWARISAVYCAATRANRRIGFSTRKQFRHFCFDTPIAHSGGVHEIENFRNLFKPTGIAFQRIPTITPPKTSSLSAIDSPYAVLHMFPSGRKSFMKEWAEQRWGEIALYLADRGIDVFFTGAGGDCERAQALTDQLNHPKIKNIAGRTNLVELSEFLSQSKIVISVNTGVMHLAAAVGAPLVALHGPTDPVRWGPLSRTEKTKILVPQAVPCAPCLNLGFEYGCSTNKCMESITSKSVIEAIDAEIC